MKHQRHPESAPSLLISTFDVFLAPLPNFRLLAPPLKTQTSRPTDTAIGRSRLGRRARESLLRGFPRAGGEPAGTEPCTPMARRDLHIYRIYMRYLRLVHGACVLFRDFSLQATK